MGKLDEIRKKLLELAAGSLFSAEGASVTYSFGPGAGTARIDGTVAGRVAVEVESRVPKQVRGALVELIFHPYPSKLLLLLPVHTGNPFTAVRQAEVILGRFPGCDAKSFGELPASQDRILMMKVPAPIRLQPTAAGAIMSRHGWSGAFDRQWRMWAGTA